MDPPAVPPGPSARQVFIVDRPKATQASVSIGCRLTDVKPETWAAFDVLEQLATDRAWTLREKWGATYGVHASVARMPGSGANLMLDGTIENAQAGKSIAALLDIVAEIAGGKVNEKIFATKRWDAGLSFMQTFAMPQSRAGAILEMVARLPWIPRRFPPAPAHGRSSSSIDPRPPRPASALAAA